MNYLGVDYGRKRVGLSFAEGELGIAVPLPPIVNHQTGAVFDKIGQLAKERKVGELVIGYPLHMDGRKGKRTEEVDEFIRGLEKRLNCKVHRVDERLSTSRVEADFKAIGKKISKKSGEIDSSAATLILQDFLEQHQMTQDFPEMEFDDE
jgi:putative Holliday junction resolvase